MEEGGGRVPIQTLDSEVRELLLGFPIVHNKYIAQGLRFANKALGRAAKCRALGASGSLVQLFPSFFSLLSMPPPPTSPASQQQISHKLKKNVQIHTIVIPHQFAPKQIVVNCEFLIKFIRTLITLILCIIHHF